MLHLKLIRINPVSASQKYTFGRMFIRDSGDKRWLDFSFSLEDKVRDINMNGKFDNDEVKVYGETAIPFGKYEGQVTYSPHFKREMPLIKNVEQFEGIRIHGGNEIEDTLGCILVAFNTDWNGKIWGSAENELTNLIYQNDSEGKFTLEIV
jgi:hypothetical protein